MNNEISEKYKVSPYLIIFPLYVSMVGIGVLTFQKMVVKHAGYNAWISVILSGISIHILIWMIYKLLSANEDSHDIAAINNKLFGKILGSFFNAAIVVYFALGAFVKFKVYIELIQVWLFPSMNFLFISIVILLLVYYAVSGGIRSVTGIAVWATMISIITIFPQVLLAFPYLHPLNLLPLWNHSLTEILLSSKDMTFNFLGFEILLLFYPFVKTPEKSQKWAHLILFMVILLYLVILVMAFMFFTEEQLRHTIWPTLNMIGIFEVPLLQRLEYIAISLWFIKIIAGISIYIWAACRASKIAFRIRPRILLVLILIAFTILCEIIRDHRTVEKLSEIYSIVGQYFIYVYIPFVLIGVLLRQRWLRHLRRTG